MSTFFQSCDGLGPLTLLLFIDVGKGIILLVSNNYFFLFFLKPVFLAIEVVQRVFLLNDARFCVLKKKFVFSIGACLPAVRQICFQSLTSNPKQVIVCWQLKSQILCVLSNLYDRFYQYLLRLARTASSSPSTGSAKPCNLIKSICNL